MLLVHLRTRTNKRNTFLHLLILIHLHIMHIQLLICTNSFLIFRSPPCSHKQCLPLE
uniref:Uncharacterized protein n=1 Tax=Anguilla anguilla TaxID=7936 RepID=A0A0E9WGJ3_ANGAN